MKYIRTKDGRILPTLWQDISTAINQADTIEELCDTFIAIAENGVICAYKTFHELKHYECVGSIELPCFPFIEKYGAIHVKNKGLIYVAKMNDKGELELL